MMMGLGFEDDYGFRVLMVGLGFEDDDGLRV
jgi:hypothetical protein